MQKAVQLPVVSKINYTLNIAGRETALVEYYHDSSDNWFSIFDDKTGEWKQTVKETPNLYYRAIVAGPEHHLVWVHLCPEEENDNGIKVRVVVHREDTIESVALVKRENGELHPDALMVEFSEDGYEHARPILSKALAHDRMEGFEIMTTPRIQWESLGERDIPRPEGDLESVDWEAFYELCVSVSKSLP